MAGTWIWISVGFIAALGFSNVHSYEANDFNVFDAGSIGLFSSRNSTPSMLDRFEVLVDVPVLSSRHGGYGQPCGRPLLQSRWTVSLWKKALFGGVMRSDYRKEVLAFTDGMRIVNWYDRYELYYNNRRVTGLDDRMRSQMRYTLDSNYGG
mmetsp:Transcript_9402/g.19238  ORF Transcript_9402/g.19238 Transcript_9402/m.19238 type:complete len:151 (+) Transcript_9402:1636-2088(+)